jgi:hypothetical protein
MENERLVKLSHICETYNVEISFVRSLNEFGLLEIIKIDETECVDKDCLGEVEKMMRLHYDLDINLAGIDAISHLLKRVHDMQAEIITLKNRINSL